MANYDNYPQDCIHLKACRRLCKIARNKGIVLGRGCSVDCSAYVAGDVDDLCGDTLYVAVETAIEYARDGASSIRGGWSEYEVYCSCDLPGKTISEIIVELAEGE